MATLKRLFVFLLSGAIVGAVVATLVAPGLIGWYNKPGVMAPAGYDLSPYAEAVMASLIKAQALGAAAGAVLLVLVGSLIKRSHSRRAAEKSARLEGTSASALPATKVPEQQR